MIPIDTIQQYVSNAAGTQITISCEATFPADRDGQVFYGSDGSLLRVLHVSQSICADAQAIDRKQSRTPTGYFTFQGQRIDADSGGALEVLLHEAMHVALQSADESVVECTAFQNRWALVKQFRLPSWVSQMLMVGMQWRHSAFGPEYHGVGGC